MNYSNRTTGIRTNSNASYANTNQLIYNTNNNNNNRASSLKKAHSNNNVRFMNDEQIRYDEPPKKPAVMFTLINTLVFGLGLSLFIVGIIYLSIYRYEYSLTTLSIDLIAGFFLAIGVVLIFLTTLRIIFIKNMQIQINIVLVIAVVLMAFFILLLVLGSVGLSMNNNDQFLHEARANLHSTARMYDESSTFKHETKKINYIQQRFNCCGVDSFNDWKSFHSYRNPNQPVKFIDKINYENAYAYRDDVPDSCCINYMANCGKQTYVFNRDRSSIINIRGCLSIYLRYFSNDLTFLCALSISVSIIFFVSSLGLAFVFMRLKESLEFEETRNTLRLLQN